MTPRRALAILGALARVDEQRQCPGARVVPFPGFARELAQAGLLRAGVVDLDRLLLLALRWQPGSYCPVNGRQQQRA